MSAKESAMNYFKQGYNCSQSVVLAFKEMLSIDEKTMLMLSSSFGGGVGRQREVCGTVSGMAIVLGILFGYSSPDDQEKKKKHYELIQNVSNQFKDVYGSIVCKELLGLKEKTSDPTPEKRTAEFYKKRPCVELVGTAAEILENYITSIK